MHPSDAALAQDQWLVKPGQTHCIQEETHRAHFIEFAELVADAFMAFGQLIEAQSAHRYIIKELHSYPAKGLAVRFDVKKHLRAITSLRHHLYW